MEVNKMSDEKITAEVRKRCATISLDWWLITVTNIIIKRSLRRGRRIPYASRVYDSSEMVNLVDSALEFWLTSGRYTDRFEKGWPVIWESATVPWSIPVLQPI